VQNLSTEKYVSAIEKNLSSWIPIFGKMGQSYSNFPLGVNRSITDIPISLFNSVMDTRLAPEQVDTAINIIQSDGMTHKVPILWWITPSTRPLDLGKHLENHGFATEDKGPGMVVELEKLNEQFPVPVGLSISLAQDDMALRQWCITMGLGFSDSSPSELFINSWYRLLSQSVSENVRVYVGWLGDRPVATSLLLLAEGVAGIYCVATVAEARRKGIGAYITQYPLIYARSQGYSIGILQSSEMGLGVYQSLGFQKYCEIVSYRWAPEKTSA
jgi:GNAT superfamily N-acetyltransferase